MAGRKSIGSECLIGLCTSTLSTGQTGCSFSAGSSLVDDPGVLTISLLAHVDAGESSQAAVIREIDEELGIPASRFKPEFLFSYRSDAEVSPTFVDRHFTDVCACWADFRLEEIEFDRREVSEVRLVTFSEFRDMVEHGSGRLAPVYGGECRELVYLFRDRLQI